MSKISKNLFLDADAVARGERFGARHSTTLSQLVSDFLARLPDESHESELTPVVRGLLGVAAPRGGDRPLGEDDYREHLWTKHGPS